MHEPSALTHGDPDRAVTVVGLSCRFPGAADPRVFWRLLRDGVDAISEVPSGRWRLDDVPEAAVLRRGGFLPDVDWFMFGSTVAKLGTGRPPASRGRR